MTNQQQETQDYFSQHASDWLNRAIGSSEVEVPVIRQRNDFVLNVVQARDRVRNLLDIGCGTGDLVCEAAKMGIDAVGVDFAVEMIDIAGQRAEEQGLRNTAFDCCSIFDFERTADRFDVISANGFIEYLDVSELPQLLNLVFGALHPGGSFVVGSRNRLFNAISMNSYTLDEIENGTIEALLREAIAISSGCTLAELAELETAPLQKEGTVHTHTGIDVGTRYQYTPAQLSRLLVVSGFTVEQVLPVHVHGVPTAFKTEYPALHTAISKVLQVRANQNQCLLPFASSFMVHAVKPGHSL